MVCDHRRDGLIQMIECVSKSRCSVAKITEFNVTSSAFIFSKAAVNNSLKLSLIFLIRHKMNNVFSHKCKYFWGTNVGDRFK